MQEFKFFNEKNRFFLSWSILFAVLIILANFLTNFIYYIILFITEKVWTNFLSKCNIHKFFEENIFLMITYSTYKGNTHKGTHKGNYSNVSSFSLILFF